MVGAITAGILLSLILVRTTASDLTAPGQPNAEQTSAPPVSVTFTTDTTTSTGPATIATPTPPTVGSAIPAESSAEPQRPAAAMVLSNGVPVDPHPDPGPRTFHPVTDPPPNAPVTPPPNEPDPATLRDPTVVATGWLNALCWYDYRGAPGDNLRRAATFGSMQMPPGQDPWTLTDAAWADVTGRQLSSACTGITTALEPITHGATTVTTVRISATQILSAAGTPFQAMPVAITRNITQDPTGRWSIGAPMTAN